MDAKNPGYFVTCRRITRNRSRPVFLEKCASTLRNRYARWLITPSIRAVQSYLEARKESRHMLKFCSQRKRRLLPFKITRPSVGLLIERLEERDTPAAVAFSSGVLTIDYSAAAESVSVNNTLDNITLSGST